MRKRLVWTLAVGTAIALAVSAVAAAERPVTLIAGKLVLKVNGGTKPRKLPRRRMAPVGVWIEGKLSTTDGTHTPALRETVIDFDKNGAINAKGLPVCTDAKLEFTDTKTAMEHCRKALVGSGIGKADFQFPDQGRFIVNSPIRVFNGGVRGKTTTLFIHAHVEEPVVVTLVTTVKITKIHKGRYGLHTVATIPRVANGAGSVYSFRFQIEKLFRHRHRKVSYLTARCTDGRFFVNVLRSIFKNEAEEEYPPESGEVVKIQGWPPVTNIHGNVLRHCIPKG
jgi:hypothetical protein